MSISQTLSNALSGIGAASRMAATTSANLANASTDGYGRRRVDLAAQTIGGAGGGVQITGITRIVERGILADRRLADAALGGQSDRARAYERLETAIGAPGDAGGLTGRIVALEAAFQAAAGDPASAIRLGDVVERMSDLTAALNAQSRDIAGLRQDADADIARQVDTLNGALARIEGLNGDIARAGAGRDTAALEDERQTAIDAVSTIVPLREIARDNGRIALMTTSGEVLIDGPAQLFDFTATPVIAPHMTRDAGLVSGITRDGQPLDGGFGRLSGGSLEAAFERRDDILVAAQRDLDAIARDLAERFGDPANDPTLTAGDAGVLTDRGTAFGAATTVGFAGRITVNAAIDPGRGGDVRLLRDGLGSTAAGPVGDGRQLRRWADGMAAPRRMAGAGPTGAVAEHAARFAARIGSDRIAAQDEATFASARWSAIRAAELEGGVDTDAEMQMLLRIEQHFAANARVIETVQSMMRTLMEL